MRSLNFSNKGQMRNYGVIIIFLFTLGFMSILGTKLMLETKIGWENTGLYTGVIQETGDKFLNATLILDYVIVVVMAVLIIGIGISTYKLATSRTFFLVTIFLGIFLGAVSYFFNYLFLQIVSQEVFSNAIIYFPKTLIICTNLHWVSLAAVVVGSITLYAKREEGDVIG